MKTLTCAQMGGPCTCAITAVSEHEMIGLGWHHVMEAHPESFEHMKNLTQEEKAAWQAHFHKLWESAHELAF